MHFKAVKKSRIRSGFVIDSYFKDRAFAAVKKGCKSCKLGLSKEFHLSLRRYTKGVPLESSVINGTVYKKARY